MLVCLSMQLQLQAQKTYISDYPQKLFDEGKKMYADNNFIACIERMEEYKKNAVNPELLKEADYYIVSASFAKNNPNTKELITEFLEQYPLSEYENRLNFLMASTSYLENDYQDAIFWFGKSDMFLLSDEEQEDYSFRFAYCLLQTNELERALPFFTVLSNSKKYGEASAYYRGYIAYIQNDYDKALTIFNSLRQSRDFQTAANFYIIQIAFIKQDYNYVIAAGEQLLGKSDLLPENRLETQRVVGESYYYKGDSYMASSFLKTYVSNSTSPARTSYYMLGATEYKERNYIAAIQYLGRVRTDNDLISQNTYLLLGQSYLQMNDKYNARMAFESASNMAFDKQIQEVAMFNCGLLTHETGYSAFGESVLIFERFLNAFPNSNYTDQANDCLVETYLTTRDYQAALSSINKIKRPTSKILEAKQKILFQIGTQYFANNYLQTAIDYFTQAINMGNYNTETKALAYFWRGESYYQQNLFKQAEKDYEMYLSNTSRKDKETYTSALYNLGYAYFKQKNYTSALTNFTRYVNAETVTTNPSFPDAYNRMGDCYFYARNMSQAEANYAKAANAGGSRDYALFQKAFVMGLQKNYTGKINTLTSLIDGYPNSTYTPDAYYEKARAYVMLGQNSNAITTFAQLESRYPQSSLSRKAGLQKGMLYFDSGDLNNAINAYKQVVSKYPQSEEAQIAVQDLKAVYLDKNDIQGYANYVRSLGGNVKFEVSEQDSLTYQAAEKLYMKNDKANARTALNNYLRSFPNGAFSINANYYLGHSYYTDKNYSEAAKYFAVVANASHNKYSEEALARSAEIAFLQKNYTNALKYAKLLNTKAESWENRQAARVTMLRSAAFLNSPQDVITAATTLLQDTKLSSELKNEALSQRAKANVQLKNVAKAAEDWAVLAKDTRNIYGAEAKYLLGQYYYDSKQYDKAEKEMKNFLQVGTPHNYWLARGFILLGDTYIAKKDYQSARQYLQSLQNNYKEKNDGILNMAQDRMKKLK